MEACFCVMWCQCEIWLLSDITEDLLVMLQLPIAVIMHSGVRCGC